MIPLLAKGTLVGKRFNSNLRPNIRIFLGAFVIQRLFNNWIKLSSTCISEPNTVSKTWLQLWTEKPNLFLPQMKESSTYNFTWNSCRIESSDSISVSSSICISKFLAILTSQINLLSSHNPMSTTLYLRCATWAKMRGNKLQITVGANHFLFQNSTDLPMPNL